MYYVYIYTYIYVCFFCTAPSHRYIHTYIYIYEQRKIFVTSSNWRGVPTSFSSPVWFLKAWPRTPLLIVFACRTSFWLAGWWLAALAGLGWLGWLAWLAGLAGWLIGWCLAGGWLAGRRAGWLAGLAGRLLAGWLAVYIIWLWMAGIWCMWAPRFYGHESDLVLTSFWPRTGPRTCTAPESAFVVLVISTKNDEHKVPTSY